MVRLCKTGLMRLGSGARVVIDGLREREHSPVVADCLDRCQVCEKALVATVDGIPIQAPDAATLLAICDQLAADE
jgi:hypothetical protein